MPITLTVMSERRVSRLPRRKRKRTVEDLLTELASLATERQTLRSREAETSVLERNRLAIVRAQWDLSHALIDRHRRAA